jgi:hypothetical protein
MLIFTLLFFYYEARACVVEEMTHSSSFVLTSDYPKHTLSEEIPENLLENCIYYLDVLNNCSASYAIKSGSSFVECLSNETCEVTAECDKIQISTVRFYHYHTLSINITNCSFLYTSYVKKECLEQPVSLVWLVMIVPIIVTIFITALVGAGIAFNAQLKTADENQSKTSSEKNDEDMIILEEDIIST